MQLNTELTPLLHYKILYLFSVERKGFEPSIRCRIHAFQACAFDHSATFLFIFYYCGVYFLVNYNNLKNILL